MRCIKQCVINDCTSATKTNAPLCSFDLLSAHCFCYIDPQTRNNAASSCKTICTSKSVHTHNSEQISWSLKAVKATDLNILHVETIEPVSSELLTYAPKLHQIFVDRMRIIKIAFDSITPDFYLTYKWTSGYFSDSGPCTQLRKICILLCTLDIHWDVKYFKIN